ncbi:YopX family protein [Enterococcus malodoratus]|uniref:YopX family protein n=1 Tax=Enterococcus malodoratus TaxID=71451 RepID=UPI0022E03A65|nr:YopX family protein [Enterococcus malodoratus]
MIDNSAIVGQQHLTTDSSTPFEIKGLVRYSKRNTMFYLDEKSFGHDKFMNSLGSSIYQFEVIGNVFANPELLEAIE